MREIRPKQQINAQTTSCRFHLKLKQITFTFYSIRVDYSGNVYTYQCVYGTSKCSFSQGTPKTTGMHNSHFSSYISLFYSKIK